MKTIINYIRSCFCKHEWEYEEARCREMDDWGGFEEGTKVSATCKKCGWHRSYWKW